jgi:creatinine amidohydrolase
MRASAAPACTRFPTATSKDAGRRAARVAVLPIGSFEQHGDFLPLLTDTVVACLIARRLSEAYDLFLLPPITISCSHEHAAFPGTVSLSARTLSAIVDDVRHSLKQSGIRRLVVVNAHGGNYVLSNVVQEANVDGRQLLLFPTRGDWERARAAAALASTAAEDMHAGELETSLLLYACPELVGQGYGDGNWLAPHRPHLLVLGMPGYTDTGVIGRPSLASVEKGRAVLDELTAAFADHLQLLE